MQYEFKPYDCIVIDESESFFSDLLSGLCRGSNFELGMRAFEKMMTTSEKVVFLDGFLKNSSLSIACNFASHLDDIRLVIATYKIERGTLQGLPPALKQAKKKPDLPNNSLTVEGLIHLVAENEGSQLGEELKLKLYDGTLFQRIKLALLKEKLKTAGPVNSVQKFTSFSANNL